jgi:3-oxoacyl-[acyl-carrier protein] reductase
MSRTALVVGGSGGIGGAICRRLAAHGFQVAVGYASSEEAAENVEASLEGDGHSVLQLRVTDSEALENAARRFEERYGHLDVLVNGAGVTRPVAHDDLDGLDDALIDWIFQVNWRGPFATVRAFRSLLERGRDPVVINISSVAGTTGQGSNVAYCASKAALDSMTRSLARALAPRVRIVSVSPGWVVGKYAERMPPELLEAQRAATPLGRLATGEDVATTVSAVARHLPFTTGVVIPVDGGRPLGNA